MSHPCVRPILPRDIEPLQTAAAADGHQLVYPTHILTRDNAVIGYFSIKPPYVNVWLHTKAIRARDTVFLLGILDALVAQSGSADYIMLCAPDSPFVPYLSKLGFTHDYTAKLVVKKLYHPEPPQ